MLLTLRLVVGLVYCVGLIVINTLRSYMALRSSLLLIVLCYAGLGSSWAQGRAALDQLLAHHSEVEVEAMRQNAHYRFTGELLFYSASFLVEENGQLRAATEEEIAGIDLHAYDGIRQQGQRTSVHDPLIDKDIVLLGRGEFERLFLERSTAADRDAYLEYRNAVLDPHDTKAP